VFAVWLLRLDQKLMDSIPMNPRRMANLLNVTPELLREFLAHLSKPDDGTVTLCADGRAVRYRLFEPPGAQTSVPRNYRYFNKPLIEVNLVFSFVPRPFTTAMIASAMPTAIIHIRLPSRRTGQPRISEPMCLCVDAVGDLIKRRSARRACGWCP
jgi:hypothetical protein